MTRKTRAAAPPPDEQFAWDDVRIFAEVARRGSLIDAIDRCVTGAGARQLAEDLSAPLTDLDAIGERLALVPAGAYGASMASDHCLRGLFCEVVV